MKNTFIFLVLGWSFICPIKAQITQEYLNIAPASPTVSELAKYAEVPVSYYTGIPEINIPLYTLQCGNITVPISLSYHAGGIQVDQVASWVGLGWSLNAGGIIKQTIYSKKPGACVSRVRTMKEVESDLLGGYDKYALKCLAESSPKPNLYSYNFLQYTGNFFVYYNKFYNTKNARDISFEEITGNMTAKDLKGTRYFFNGNDRESTVQTTSSYFYEKGGLTETIGPDDDIFSSWSLSKIVSPYFTDSVMFQYTNQEESYRTMISGTLLYKDNGWDGGYPENAPSFHGSTIKIYTKKISQITTSDGLIITFIADFPRKDLARDYTLAQPVPRALTEIIVKSPQGNILKKWKFEYDYFDSRRSMNNDPTTSYRLKLKSLKEYGSNDNMPRVYCFSYYKENSDEPQMFPRTAYAGRDYWGYCNGDNSDFNILHKSFPKINQEFRELCQYMYVPGEGKFPINWELDGLPKDDDTYQVYLDGGNKNVNEDFIDTYSLKEIVYPTGGKRIFEYESNDGRSAGLRIKKIKDYPSETDSLVKKYEYPYRTQVLNTPKMTKTKYVEKAEVSKHGFMPGMGEIIEETFVTRTGYLEVSSQSYYSLFSIEGDHLGYELVLEKSPSGTVCYNYYSMEYFPHNYDSYRIIKGEDEYIVYTKRLFEPVDPFIWGFWGQSYGRGVLASKMYLNKENEILKSEVYEYTFQDTDTINVVEVVYGVPGWNSTQRKYFDYNTSRLVVGESILDKKTTTYYNPEIQIDYVSKKEMIVEEKYDYNAYKLPKTTETINSKGEKEVTEIKYPLDINAGPYNDMCNKQMIDYPVEVVKKVNGVVVSGNLQTYDSSASKVLPKALYSFSRESSSFTNFNGAVPAIYGEPDAVVTEYSSKGRILTLTKSDQMSVAYIWGYNNMYPIAEIKNTTYAAIERYISRATLEIIAARAVPTQSDWQIIENLKNSLPDIYITTYTYIPFVGVSSIRGPDKRPVYYDYDSFGQLSRTYKKENGADVTLESYEYHYHTN